MAVPEQTPYIEHIGNGVTTSFALKFQCESKDHLIVLVDEIEPPIETWSLTGGNVVFTTAPAADKKITLQRNTPFSRTTDYQSYNNSFRPPAVNKDFDWIWLKLQELGVADWILGARIDALKNYVDRKDDELKAYLMEEIRKQGVALDQLDEYYNYLMQRLAQIAVDKGWDASFVVDGNENQHEINNTVVRIKKSVAEMLAINNPKSGQLVRTLSYHAGLSKGGNTYRYEPSRQLENDGGSVLSGWVVQDKTALTVWDFGYKDGDADVSRTALSNALTSGFPLELLAETLDAHIGGAPLSYNHWQTITQNKLIFGQGRDVSIISGLRLQSHSDVLIARDFSINENGLNYALFPLEYNFLLIDNFSSKGNLDAVLVMHAKSSQSKALIRNCYSENSSRIGFTADVGAKNVTFENCRSFNCRQGFHAEEEADTTFIDCIADMCGNDAMPAIDYQPPEYAGGFRLHKYTRTKLIRCKNINKNGTNIDQLGGGGTGLYIEQCEGINFLVDFGATETYRDIEVKGLKDGGIALTSFSAKIAGRIIVHDFDGGADFGALELASNTVDTVNVVTYAEFVNVKAARLQITSQANDATIHMHNVFVRSPYFNFIRGFTHHVLGDLVYSWNNSGETHYPNLGFRFESTKAKTFSLQSFRSVGATSGYHLNFENFPVTCKPVIVSALDKGGAYHIRSNVPYLDLSESQARTAPATSVQLGQATYALNTQNKLLGRDVYNTTIGKFMKATGSSATSTWVSYDGATTITPA